MLTRVQLRNFKRFEDVTIELGNPVVFIGPNNSGKTTALQALALWDIGLRRWNEKRKGTRPPERRPGVTINRRDLYAMPVPDADLLWRDLHTREIRRTTGRQDTQNIRMEIVVEGVEPGRSWQCGLEFDYANAESFYCRPLRLTRDGSQRMPVPQDLEVRTAFLPPMSGLADVEFIKQPGEISVLVGQGRTAEVLRNLCWQVWQSEDGTAKWDRLATRLKRLFGVELDEPKLIPERSEIVLSYRERSKVRLDLASAGRGLHQTLLLLAYISANPGSVLLLDEPDAHLECLRQRQIYEVLVEAARETGCQVIAASHSEVLLNEAADRDVVIAFVGTPHRIDDRGSQVLKSLREIGFDQYYQVEQTGWVLYLEGSTDLAILRAFAEKLQHPAERALERPFLHVVQNIPSRAREHFFGLREAKPDLVGLAIYDRLDRDLSSEWPLREIAWQRREIENYLCSPATLMAFAEDLAERSAPGPLFAPEQRERMRAAMQTTIEELVPPIALRDPHDPYWRDVKASDDFLDRLFPRFYERVGMADLVRKSDYHILARFVETADLDEEVVAMLDAIVETAARAHPRTE